MSEDIKSLRAEFEAARAEGLRNIEAAPDARSLEDARVAVLGRKAPLARLRGGLGKLSNDDRRDVGALANEIQSALESAFQEKKLLFEEADRAKRWEQERVDVTLPGASLPVGAVHPLTKTIWEIVDIFVGLGYLVADGPEIELSTYNFDAINTPPEHPSRSPSDTFYIAGSEEAVCLRTHTSPVQIRTMEAQEPPVYVVIPGRVYRRDAVDATHLPFFAQIEGLAVDQGITMADLKGTLEAFARAIFGESLALRFRPHFFPFTEPSAEVDVECFSCRGAGCRICKKEGWIEILGAGMVHPSLLEGVGYDTERFTGFAFGVGVERVAALAHGVGDIRHFYENDLRFLSQFTMPAGSGAAR
ncbi:MAG TPA: phenylalanine--tRNA ligase subunit alpha [Actinomycetota bacterium]|nr:phenylalanine--tRNA ligase subunit alpha [Actinomycetota bacterium]